MVDARTLERSHALLSASERDRALRYRRPDGGAEFTVSRAALRWVLSCHTGVAPGDLTFAYGVSGKPSLDAPVPVAFSLSHADGVVLVAVAADAVGIDIEVLRPRPRMARIAERFLGAETATRLAALPPDERQLAFHHAWTRHEAWIKAIGGAVFGTTGSIEFRWPPDAGPQRIHASDGVEWSVLALPAGNARVAALVARGRVDDVQVHSPPAIPED